MTSTSGSVGQSLLYGGVATGPLPERAGAALGGVLTVGDLAPQLDRNDAARVDLGLMGLAADSESAQEIIDGELAAGWFDLDTDTDNAPADDSVGDEPLIGLPGPGGFPLLTTSLHAGAAVGSVNSTEGQSLAGSESTPRSNPTDVPVKIDALIAALPAIPDHPELGTTDPGIEIDQAAATVASRDIASSDPTLPTRNRRGPRSSAISSLSVAAVMVFGLILPDLSTLMTIREVRRYRLPNRFRFRVRMPRRPLD